MRNTKYIPFAELLFSFLIKHGPPCIFSMFAVFIFYFSLVIHKTSAANSELCPVKYLCSAREHLKLWEPIFSLIYWFSFFYFFTVTPALCLLSLVSCIGPFLSVIDFSVLSPYKTRWFDHRLWYDGPLTSTHPGWSKANTHTVWWKSPGCSTEAAWRFSPSSLTLNTSNDTHVRSMKSRKSSAKVKSLERWMGEETKRWQKTKIENATESRNHREGPSGRCGNEIHRGGRGA